MDVGYREGMGECYGAAPTQGQRSLVRDQEDLVLRDEAERGSLPHRLNRSLERKC